MATDPALLLACVTDELSSRGDRASNRIAVKTFMKTAFTRPPLMLAESVSSSALQAFVFALFERHWGSNEHVSNAASLPMPSSDILAPAGDPLAPVCDALLKFLRLQPLSVPSVQALEFLVVHTDKPYVRDQAFRYFFEWLRSHLDALEPVALSELLSVPPVADDDFDEPEVSLSTCLLRMIEHGLIDVWSAIRKMCAKKLCGLVTRLGLLNIEALATSLLEICASDDSDCEKRCSWQAKDGALMGLDSILMAFEYDMAASSTLTNPTGPAPAVNLLLPTKVGFKVGKESSGEEGESELSVPWKSDHAPLRLGDSVLPALPSFVTPLPSILYRMLAHPQLSVRIAASKLFTSYLARCNSSTTFATFSEIIARLGSRNASEQFEPVRLLDAYEAEGLLGLFSNVLARVPAPVLLKLWQTFVPILTDYLAHPASTVRQVTSVIFVRLVNKGPSLSLPQSWQVWPCGSSAVISTTLNPLPGSGLNSLFLRLVLQALSAPWRVPRDLPQQSTYQSNFASFVGSPFSLHRHDVLSPSATQPDIEAAVHSSLPPELPAMPRSRTALPVANHVHHTDQIGTEPHSWEWREGRLMCYELILERLLANHEQVITSVERSTLSPIGRYAKDKRRITPSFASPLTSPASNTSTPTAVLQTPNARSHRRAGSLQAPNSIASTPVSAGSKSGARKFSFPFDHSSANADLVAAPSSSPGNGFQCLKHEAMVGSSAESNFKDISSANLSILEEISFIDPRLWSAAASSSASPSPVNSDVNSPSHALDTNSTHAALVTPNPRANLTRHLSSPAPHSDSVRSEADLLSSDRSRTVTHMNTMPDLAAAFSIVTPQYPDTEFHAFLEMYFSTSTAASTSCFQCELETDVQRFRLITFSSILHQMLVQSVACSLESRWELRRMADQVLPLLVQVLSWFDMQRLESVWSKYLLSGHDFLHYVACLSLKYALRTAIELRRQLSDSQVNDSESTAHNTKQLQMQLIVQNVSDAVSALLPRFLILSERTGADKITTLCTEILIMILAHFPDRLLVEKDRSAAFSAVCRRISTIRRLTSSRNSSFFSAPVQLSDVCRASIDSVALSALSLSSVSTPDVTLLAELTALFGANIAVDSAGAGAHILMSPHAAMTPASQPSPAASRMKRAERVEQWLLSCVFESWPHLMHHASLQQAILLVPHTLEYLTVHGDREIRSALLDSILTFWTRAAEHAAASEHWSAALELAGVHTTNSCSMLMEPLPINSTRAVPPFDSGHIKTCLALLRVTHASVLHLSTATFITLLNAICARTIDAAPNRSTSFFEPQLRLLHASPMKAPNLFRRRTLSSAPGRAPMSPSIVATVCPTSPSHQALLSSPARPVSAPALSSNPSFDNEAPEPRGVRLSMDDTATDNLVGPPALMESCMEEEQFDADEFDDWDDWDEDDGLGNGDLDELAAEFKAFLTILLADKSVDVSTLLPPAAVTAFLEDVGQGSASLGESLKSAGANAHFVDAWCAINSVNQLVIIWLLSFTKKNA